MAAFAATQPPEQTPASGTLDLSFTGADLPQPPFPPATSLYPSPWVKLIAAIAALAAIALGLDNLRLRNQLTVATQASEAIARNSTPNPLIPSLASILQRPKSRLVALQNADASLSGTLLFTPGQWQEVVVAFGNLPPLPPDQVYRMWLEMANGEVLPCGEFQPDATGQVFLKLTPPKTPQKGVKATGIFVTIDARQAPLQPTANRLLSGTI
ncbi:MAG: anti-sigma factor [Synechococcales cyanobacterium CRU_2_2]|nr:anti-sigma factor [Synechococcales cyanobacterium CRU_2_2]